MKRFVLIFIFSAALQSFGQTDSLEIISFQDTLVPVEGEISDVFEMAPMEMPEEEMYNEKDYIRYMCFFTGVDFGLLSLQNETYPIKQKQSFSFRLNLVEYKKQLIENRFGVFSGIAMGYQQIGFQDDFKFINSGSETILVPDTIDYLKN